MLHTSNVYALSWQVYDNVASYARLQWYHQAVLRACYYQWGDAAHSPGVQQSLHHGELQQSGQVAATIRAAGLAV